MIGIPRADVIGERPPKRAPRMTSVTAIPCLPSRTPLHLPSLAVPDRISSALTQVGLATVVKPRPAHSDPPARAPSSQGEVLHPLRMHREARKDKKDVPTAAHRPKHE